MLDGGADMLEASGERQGNMDEDEHNELDVEDEQGEVVPAHDLPYKDKFIPLTNLSSDSDAFSGINPQPVDVDIWELVIPPEEYLSRFKDTLSTIQLIKRVPLRRMHTTYHRGPAFDTWLLLAEANH
jgi:hypothetical protein